MLPLSLICAATPEDEQIGDILGYGYYGTTLLVIIITVIALYIILFLIRRALIKGINSEISEATSSLDISDRSKNSYGILQISGNHNGRRIFIHDHSIVWASPRPVVVTMSHRLSSVDEKITEDGFTISRCYARQILTGWPENLSYYLDTLDDRLDRLEKSTG